MNVCPVQHDLNHYHTTLSQAEASYNARPKADWGMALDALADIEDLVTEINEALDEDITLRDFVRQAAIRQLSLNNSIQNDEYDLEAALEVFE